MRLVMGLLIHIPHMYASFRAVQRKRTGEEKLCILSYWLKLILFFVQILLYLCSVYGLHVENLLDITLHLTRHTSRI